MTICIGAINSNGKSVIIASDSMITSMALSIEFEQPTNTKMTVLGEHCVALTAGDALVHTEVFDVAEDEIAKLGNASVDDIVGVVAKSYHKIREKHIIERYLRPRGFATMSEYINNQQKIYNDIAWDMQSNIGKYNLGLEILVAGVNDNKAHLYVVNNPGTSSCCDSLGFYAIGSGLPHALNSLIARSCHASLSPEECLINVYESKHMAEKAPGVGSNVTNIAILNQDGISQLAEEDISKLSNALNNKINNKDWKKEVTEIINNRGNKNEKKSK